MQKEQITNKIKELANKILINLFYFIIFLPIAILTNKFYTFKKKESPKTTAWNEEIINVDLDFFNKPW